MDASEHVEEQAPDVDMEFVGELNLVSGLGHLQPSVDESVSALVLAQMGSSGRSYAREKASGARRILAEIDFPPSATEMIRRSKSKHVVPGYAFDLTTVDPEDGQPWHFSIPAKRERARRLLREQAPYMLIGSPMCRAFSSWQRLNAVKCSDPEAMKRARVEAIVHMDFVAELYAEQVRGGRYFLHEHPLRATSWELKSMREVMQLENVRRVHGDQCIFGAQA